MEWLIEDYNFPSRLYIRIFKFTSLKHYFTIIFSIFSQLLIGLPT